MAKRKKGGSAPPGEFDFSKYFENVTKEELDDFLCLIDGKPVARRIRESGKERVVQVGVSSVKTMRGTLAGGRLVSGVAATSLPEWAKQLLRDLVNRIIDVMDVGVGDGQPQTE